MNIIEPQRDYESYNLLTSQLVKLKVLSRGRKLCEINFFTWTEQGGCVFFQKA